MVEYSRNGIKYINIRTRKVVDIPIKLGMDLEAVYNEVGADALIEFANHWLKNTDIELVKKKKGGKK